MSCRPPQLPSLGIQQFIHRFDRIPFDHVWTHPGPPQPALIAYLCTVLKNAAFSRSRFSLYAALTVLWEISATDLPIPFLSIPRLSAS